MNRLSKCRLIELPKIDDSRGSLSFAEAGLNVPFDIKRVFFIHQVPPGATRAGHALKTCEQLIVATCGAFDAIISDGKVQSRRRLDSAKFGLYVPPLIWLELENFLLGSVCLVLASEAYSEDSYIRTTEQFGMVVA